MQIRIRNPGTKLKLSSTYLKFMTGLLPTAGPKLSTVFSLNSILLRESQENVQINDFYQMRLFYRKTQHCFTLKYDLLQNR